MELSILSIKEWSHDASYELSLNGGSADGVQCG